MNRQEMDRQLSQVFDQVRHRIVEQASPSLQSMAQMEDLIYGELNRCKPEVLQVFPLDNTATVAGYPVTPRTAQVAVEEACERTYGQAVKHLQRGHSIRMGKELLENLCQAVGDYWLAQDRQRLESAQEAHTAPAASLEAETCVVFADGVMVHTDGDWHEARVGTVRSSVGDRTVFKSSIARLCPVQDFGEDLWRHACESGYRNASLTAFIADGSHWLWTLADRHFQRAVKIVDFWHVCEYVSACAQAFFGEGTEAARQWSLTVRGRLRAGDVAGALQLSLIHI